MDLKEELERCKKDPIYFIENYYIINGKKIKLHDYQKAFINWIQRKNGLLSDEICRILYFNSEEYWLIKDSEDIDNLITELANE